MKKVECVDLWGNPIVVEVSEAKSGRKTTVPKGYAAPPGTGPEGERCNTCLHRYRTSDTARAYQKCLLMRAVWTGGPGTDIKARSPACRLWEKDTRRKDDE